MSRRRRNPRGLVGFFWSAPEPARGSGSSSFTPPGCAPELGRPQVPSLHTRHEHLPLGEHSYPAAPERPPAYGIFSVSVQAVYLPHGGRNPPRFFGKIALRVFGENQKRKPRFKTALIIEAMASWERWLCAFFWWNSKVQTEL